jgi:CRISPR-associated protein Csm1
MIAEKERSIVFAAWVKNIDRFYTDGARQLILKSKELLSYYIDVEYLLAIIEYPTDYPKETQMIQYAYELSLSETEVKEKMSTKKNLTSVFSRITVQDGQQDCDKMYYSLGTESVQRAFPIAWTDDTELGKLAKAFEEELCKVQEKPPKTWELFITVFDNLVRKYMWCITASDYEGEDISLYNQSRIAAAIAQCICRTVTDLQNWEIDKEKQYFKLLVGDFSGIQKYIFSVANVSRPGVAKRLRARSLYVDITVSVIAQMMIEQFSLTQNHILMLTSGKFYLLLPNLDDSDKTLEQLEQEVEDDFYSKFKGQVSVNMAWISISGKGLEQYSQSIVTISRKLGEKKSRSFYHALTKDGSWDENQFILNHELANKRICLSCQSEFVDKEKEFCPTCQMHTEMGTQLPRTKYISYYHGKQKGSYNIYKDYWIRLDKTLKEDDAFLIEKINEGDIYSEKETSLPIKMRYMANHIPVKENGEVKTFSDISDMANGTSKLAVLKADVDTLGYIFADGLRKKERHYGTISRVNTMSRLLEIFFAGYINELLTTNKEYQDVYSVFSGGDDLFLIGPWNVMPKLAIVIEKQFRQFVAKNPALTLSATVSIFRPKEHIANLAEISEERLKVVKNTTIKELYPDKEGRDGVSFMGELYSWNDLKEQLAVGDRLADLLAKKMVNSQILRRIGNYSQMYRRFLLDKDVLGLMMEPLSHYDQQRNYTKLNRNLDEVQWFLKYTKNMTKNVADYRCVKKNLYFAEMMVTYAMNLTKEERNSGR